MVSIIAGLAVAGIAFFIALYKRRTGWHWFALTAIAFALSWMLSAAGLYIAGVHLPFAVVDKELAGFVGVLTGIVIVAILIFVPQRPRRHSVTLEARSRPEQTETR